MKKNRKIYWLFLAPSLLGVAVFYCVPFLYAAYYAVIDNIGSGQFVGLQNFIDVLQNELFRTAAKNTLIFMALTVPFGMALALLTALCLRKISRGRQLLSLCLLLPLVVPSGTGAYFWKILFDQNGLLIRTLVLFGVPHESLIQLNGRMAILVFVFLWKTVSYNTILFWSGLNWIPKTYYEQMALEGGGHLAQFRQVTWIYLAPTTFVVFLMSVVNAFKVFKEIYMLFGAYPGPDIYMLQHYMNNLFAALNLPRLSSIAFYSCASAQCCSWCSVCKSAFRTRWNRGRA